jgi:tRNA threonylcarbamoyladenosine biosynthesis protein TsaE
VSADSQGFLRETSCPSWFTLLGFYTDSVSGEVKTSEARREVTTQSADETIAFGRTLAELLAPPKIVLLRGDLGAGKTTLVKGIAVAFDAASEDDVTSPTFTLIHEYRGPRATLFHIDLYRIDTQRELDTLALDDLRAENSILLIEWGEKFPRFVRERDVEISLEREGETGRKIRVSSPKRD